MGLSDEQAVLEEAWQAAQRAYAPYSEFPVGAALLTPGGRIFAGCNVENASYGLTICAERVAIGRAVAEGEREFSLLVVCAPGGAAPCGACRQVLHEFSPGLLIVTANPDKEIVGRLPLSNLLPHSFDATSLDA